VVADSEHHHNPDTSFQLTEKADPSSRHLRREVGLRAYGPRSVCGLFHRIVHGGRVGKIGRHAIVDRDHLEAADPCHQGCFAGAGLARRIDIAAAVNVIEQAVLIGGRGRSCAMSAIPPIPVQKQT